jgi:predicted DNA-binding transcriptional regulator YafY
MARNRQLVRELVVLQLLDSQCGRTLNELAAKTGVTTRTIRRDIEAIEQAGIPLVDHRSEGSPVPRWRVYNWRKEAA